MRHGDSTAQQPLRTLVGQSTGPTTGDSAAPPSTLLVALRGILRVLANYIVYTRHNTCTSTPECSSRRGALLITLLSCRFDAQKVLH
jgi:hypothetical protein